MFVVMMSSCTNSEIRNKMDALAPETVALGETFYTYLLDEEFDATYDMFSLSLYEEYSKNDIKEILMYLYDKHGNITSYELINTSFKTSIRADNTYYIITNDYKVRYASNYLAKEQLMYKVDLNMNTVEKIDAYKSKNFNAKD